MQRVRVVWIDLLEQGPNDVQSIVHSAWNSSVIWLILFCSTCSHLLSPRHFLEAYPPAGPRHGHCSRRQTGHPRSTHWTASRRGSSPCYQMTLSWRQIEKKKLYECKKDVGRAANSACAKNTAGKYNIMLKLQRKHLKRRFPNTLNYVCFFKWVCYWRFFSTINTISFNKHAKHHWRVLWAHRRRKRRSAARSRQVHLGVQAALTWMVDIN